MAQTQQREMSPRTSMLDLLQRAHPNRRLPHGTPEERAAARKLARVQLGSQTPKHGSNDLDAALHSLFPNCQVEIFVSRRRDSQGRHLVYVLVPDEHVDQCRLQLASVFEENRPQPWWAARLAPVISAASAWSDVTPGQRHVVSLPASA